MRHYGSDKGHTLKVRQSDDATLYDQVSCIFTYASCQMFNYTIKCRISSQILKSTCRCTIRVNNNEEKKKAKEVENKNSFPLEAV